MVVSSANREGIREDTVRAMLSLAIWKYPGGAENGGVLNSGESSGLRIATVR